MDLRELVEHHWAPVANVADVARAAEPFIHLLKESGWTVHFSYSATPEGAQFSLAADKPASERRDAP